MTDFRAPTRAVNRVFLHCSASDNPDHDDVRVIREWHLKRGFDGVGYHYYIKKDGTLQAGRSLERSPAAQEGHNTGTIAICLGGLARFSEAQFETLRGLCAAIHRQLPLATFHGHREVNPGKTCPVYDYRAALNLDGKGRMLA